MTTAVSVFGPEFADDLEELFGSDPIVDRCWCMWYLVRVEDFHAAGREGNRAAFDDLVTSTNAPVGVIAHQDGEAVGWCAVGPRARYTRLLKTPTLRGRDRNEDEDVWIVPCFFVKDGARRGGVSAELLRAAVEVAQQHGAKAIEGFPDAPKKRSERGARGTESTFEACGFTSLAPLGRPGDHAPGAPLGQEPDSWDHSI